MNEVFKYDVFISHSSKDKPAVRLLAERLMADGLHVWFDEWEIRPGDMIGLKIEEGLEQSRVMLLVMSANAFASDWIQSERLTVTFRDPTNTQRRFIPLRLDDAPLVDSLKQYAYIDWREKSEKEYQRLLEACRLAAPDADAGSENEYTVLKVLEGHKDRVQCVAMTQDGQRAVSGAADGSLRLWDLKTGEALAVLKAGATPLSIALTPDGRRAVTGSEDATVRVWDVELRRCLLTLKGHAGAVRAVALTVDGERAVSGSTDKTVRVWSMNSAQYLMVLEGHTGRVNSVALTSDGARIVSGSEDKTIRIWDVTTGECLNVLKGHNDEVHGVAVTPDATRVVSGSYGGTVRVWDIATGECLMTLKGHSGPIPSVAVGVHRAISASRDHTVKVWDLNLGNCAATLRGHTRDVTSVAMTPDGRRVISGSFDKSLRVCEISSPTDSSEVTSYTNAKVLFVGDSGVGKTGLAVRLAEGLFRPTASKHGAWATQIKLPDDTSTDNVKREVWLWDLAGQPDYRLVHQLFMDETTLAVLVFDPQSKDPFEGLAQWDRDLTKAARRPFRKLLVAGRCDRGGLTVNRKSIEQFRKEHGFDEYVETSALTGRGCSELRESIIRHVPWDDIPWTQSPRIFKLLKDEILKLKDEGKVLLRMSELTQQMEIRLPAESFTLAHLRAVVRLLAGPGIVWQLEFGDFVLLQPEYINSYAAAVLQTIRAHIDEIGSIFEEDVLRGNLTYQGMERLPREEEQIVLRAIHQTFVDHGLCLREHTEGGTLLVFPSYFRRGRPEPKKVQSPSVTYRFSGMLDEIYATLIVRLHYTRAFDNEQLWHYAADFRTPSNQIISLKLTKTGEGSGDISISFAEGIPAETQVLFVRYVHEHLKEKATDVVRLRHYICPHCRGPIEPSHAQARLRRGRNNISCPQCDRRFLLLDAIEEKFGSDDITRRVREMDEAARTSIDGESRELILLGHAFSIAGEAGQIFRPTSISDWGIDGEIEFRDEAGDASGHRVYLQFKINDHYLHTLKQDGTEVFTVKNPRHVEYWQQATSPVMLVTRTLEGQIRWMNVTDYLQRHDKGVDQIVFKGEPFTAFNLIHLRDSLASRGSARAKELAREGQRCVEAGRLDDAVNQFVEFLSLRPPGRDRWWRMAREGLLEVARRSVKESPGRMNLALATLIKLEPEWLARRLSSGVKLAEVSLGDALNVRLETKLMPVALVAADSSGFGWEVQMAPVNASEKGGQSFTVPVTAAPEGDNVIRLTADVPELAWGLYLLTVRFLEGRREHWRENRSVSRSEFKNPYIAGPPIRKPELFFGRDDLLNDVNSWLDDYSVLLLGPRRSGKTSFLYQLARIASADRTTVLIDLHSFAGYSTLKMGAGLRREIFRACVPGSAARVPSDLRVLQRRIQEAGVKQLLILLDEMAVLAKHPAVALQLRAMSKWQQPDTRLIVAGTASDMSKVANAALDIGSPPFNEFRTCELEELSKQHACELLEKPVLGFYRYDSVAIEMLLKLGGGHPFFLNILAQLVLKFVQADGERIIRPVHVTAARREATYELGRWFQEFVVELAPATRAALPALVRECPEFLTLLHGEPLRNAGLTVGPRHQLQLNPLFVEWWNSSIKEDG